MDDAPPPRDPQLGTVMRRLRGVPGVWLAAVLTVVACAPLLRNAFTYDDGRIVRAVSVSGRQNPMVSELRPVADYFTTEYWTGSGVAALHSNPLYRPVSVWSFALTHALAPGDGKEASEAWPHHLLNLLLHVANMLLVFFVTRWWPRASACR